MTFVRIARAVDHPNIIQTYDVYQDYDSIHIVQRNCSDLNLDSASLTPLTIKHAYTYITAIELMDDNLNSYIYCHQRRWERFDGVCQICNTVHSPCAGRSLNGFLVSSVYLLDRIRN